LVSCDAIALANVVYELAPGLLFMPVLFHPNSKRILPVEEYAIRIN
jgi:hypothetical protein